MNMRSIGRILLTLIGTAMACHAAGAQTTAPAAVDQAVAPFITAGTLLVAQVDLSRFDPTVIHHALIADAQGAGNPQRLGQITRWLHPELYPAQRWLSDFRKAGGRSVYAVAFLGDPAELPGVVIVPLSLNADARAIAGLLVSGKSDGPDHLDNMAGGCDAIVLHGAVVYGLSVQVEKMKAARPVDRPELAEALAALGNAPVKIAFSPSLALQLAAGELLPERLPDFAGGGVPVMLVHTLAWAAVGTSPPPDPYVHLLIQCRDPDGAQAYSDVAGALLTALSADSDWRKMMPEMDKVVAALKPSVSGNQLLLNLDTRTLDHLIVPQLLLAAPGDLPAPDFGEFSRAATQP